jgi:probable rRNA maturation factor
MSYEISIELDSSTRVLDPVPIKALIEQVLVEEGVAACAVALLFAGDELLLRLNREYRSREECTDVLAFPAEEGETLPQDEDESPLLFLGDIAVSVPAVSRQADAAGLIFDDELFHVVLHGLLHLLGYDHVDANDAAMMNEREEAILGDGIHATDSCHDS